MFILMLNCFFDCLDNSYHPKFRSTGCIPFVDKTDLLDEEKGVDLILMEEDAIDYSEWYMSSCTKETINVYGT